ncbi:MAG: hypothetical protein ABJN62_12930 [Halioglobus sp.]
MSFFGKLQERHVFRVGAGYMVSAWLLMQIADVVMPTFDTPQWVLQALIVFLVLGFPVSLLLAWAYELTPQGLKRERDVEPDSSESSVERSDAQVQTGAESRARLEDSIAVLPFANLSPNAEDKFFASGLHDEILNQLTNISAFNVIARTSVLQYENSLKSVGQIAQELNVEHIVEGSVRFAQNRVRVTAQLIDAETESHLWSETYQRPFDDIFAIESDISLSVAKALKATLSLAEQMEIKRAPTTSPAAYGLYLQARFIITTGAGAASQAHDLLDRALRIDPRFSRACGLKAMLYSTLYVNTEQSSSADATDQKELENTVRSWADRAFDLEPKNAEARSAIRTLSILTWRWTDFQSALEPGDESRLLTFGLWFYSWIGQKEYAVELGERVVDLDPNDPAAHMSLGVVYAYAGRRQASINSFRRMNELSPEVVLGHHWMIFNEIALGNQENALREMSLVKNLLADDDRKIVFLPDLAYAHARLGLHDEARNIVEEMAAIGSKLDLGAGSWATAYLALGDEKKALEQLEIVAEKARRNEPDAGFLNVMSLRMNHMDDPSLAKPEFEEVFKKIVGE